MRLLILGEAWRRLPSLPAKESRGRPGSLSEGVRVRQQLEEAGFQMKPGLNANSRGRLLLFLTV